MKKKLFTIVMLVAAGIAAADEGGITWPQGASVAVSLTYDDALESQLDNAVPVLDEHGFKGTFYLAVGRDVMRDRLDDWRALAAAGHELGNHTIYHPCRASLPDRDWVLPQHDLDNKTVAQMREEILVANTFLMAVDRQTERTYAATCYDVDTKNGDYLAVSADAHAELVRFLAANADTYWVDTYENIMTHVKDQHAGSTGD